jgi:hypothetical protein
MRERGSINQNQIIITYYHIFNCQPPHGFIPEVAEITCCLLWLFGFVVYDILFL